MKYFTVRKVYAAFCLLPFLIACNPPQKNDAQAVFDQKESRYPYPHHDTVGNFGGIPIRFSSYITPGPVVSYEDTPSGLSKEWETYNPPPRTLESPLTGFLVIWNLKTDEIYDVRNQTAYDYYDSAKKPENPWVEFSYHADKTPWPSDFLTKRLERDLRYKPTLPEYSFKPTGEKLYGLEVYKQLEPDTNTKTTDTLFIGRDKNGNVTTYISCFDNNKNESINPPCSHDFLSGSNPYIKFTASYSRFYLKDWRKIESQSKKILEEFKDNAKHPERKL